MGDEHDKIPETRWQQLRKAATGVLESGTLETAFEKTKDLASIGGRAATTAYADARNTITQEEAWEQMEASVTALTEVARVQHAMILDLLDRVVALECAAPSSTTASDK